MEEVIKAVKETLLSMPERKKLYIKLVDAFENADCDTLYECKGVDPAFDVLFPDEEE